MTSLLNRVDPQLVDSALDTPQSSTRHLLVLLSRVTESTRQRVGVLPQDPKEQSRMTPDPARDLREDGPVPPHLILPRSEPRAGDPHSLIASQQRIDAARVNRTHRPPVRDVTFARREADIPEGEVVRRQQIFERTEHNQTSGSQDESLQSLVGLESLDDAEEAFGSPFGTNFKLFEG
jgi:hypothetical protein